MNKIKLIKIGEVPKKIMDILEEELNKRFKSKFTVGKKIDLPKEAFDKYKEQYNAEVILEKLKGLKKNNKGVIGITEKDIYVRGLNFIFGLTKNGTGMVSTARLKEEFYDRGKNFELLMERLLKETIHEIGHLFGLSHCKNSTCVMSFSNSISYVDDKRDEFCKECTLKMSMEGIQI